VTTGPAVTIAGTPAEGAATNQPVDLTFSAPGGVRFECRRDGGAFVACTSPQRFGFAAAGADDGEHTFDVRAVDALGNVSQPARRTFRWDTTGPTITTLSGGPPEGGSTNQSVFFFGFTASEIGATFECQLDALALHACPGPELINLSQQEGEHTFRVRALDPLGNRGPFLVRNFRVDTLQPRVLFDAFPPDECPPSDRNGPRLGFQLVASSATFTFHSDDPTAGFVCALDIPPDASPRNLGQLCTSPHTVSNLALTSHTLWVCAVDPASNFQCLGRTWNNVAVCPPL
jgi:hypothetical protein